jgi:hypothetical protein
MREASNHSEPRPWTDQDVELLIRWIEQQMPEHLLCALLKRNAGEIGQKMRELALTFSSPGEGPQDASGLAVPP